MRGRLSRSVLSSSQRADKEDAAWELLDAVSDLFPERFAELEALGLDPAYDDLEDRYGEQYDDLGDRVSDWTLQNGISCSAVNEVATRIAAGEQTPGFWFTIPTEEPPTIHADPSRETRSEFLDRAGRHYDEMVTHYSEQGFRKRPIKRERDHFRWLAAQLVGRQTCAEIAERDDLNPLNLSEKTIAGEARKVAGLIGISMPSTRGPRPGSHHTPRGRRRRR